MDALKALRDDGFHAEQVRAFRRPIARRAGAVFLSGENDERNFRRLIFYGRVVDGNCFGERARPGRSRSRPDFDSLSHGCRGDNLRRRGVCAPIKFRHTAFDTGHHQVFDAHVRECPARHHLIVAAARAVTVEING